MNIALRPLLTEDLMSEKKSIRVSSTNYYDVPSALKKVCYCVPETSTGRSARQSKVANAHETFPDCERRTVERCKWTWQEEGVACCHRCAFVFSHQARTQRLIIWKWILKVRFRFAVEVKVYKMEQRQTLAHALKGEIHQVKKAKPTDKCFSFKSNPSTFLIDKSI